MNGRVHFVEPQPSGLSQFARAFAESLQRNQALRNQMLAYQARAGYMEPMPPGEVPPPQPVGVIDPRRMMPQFAHYPSGAGARQAVGIRGGGVGLLQEPLRAAQAQPQPIYWGGQPWRATTPEAAELRKEKAQSQRRMDFLRSIGAITTTAEPGTPMWQQMAAKIKARTGAVVTPASGALPLGKEEIDLGALGKYPGLKIGIPGTDFSYRVPVTKPMPSVWKQSGLSDLGRNTILGTLRAGYYLHPITNQRLPLREKQEAVEYIQRRGYLTYEQDPEIMSVINALPTKQVKPKKKGWFLGREETAPITTPALDLTNAETRFNQLVGQGVSETEAYQRLMREGF